ncbi:MAG TPA: glycosyltransferase family 4 protein [Blastocatellia bacterium]|nr:glycosyltransferase family 4 protein [Blastocatellia bacterium]
MTTRVLLVSSQPIQNAEPLRMMARDPRVEMLTAYCSLPDAKLWRGDENLTKEAFDIPMLDGYSWEQVRNYSPSARLGKFYGLINPGVMALVSRYDCCVVYGHAYVSFWLAICTAKLLGKPVLLGTDATYIDPHNGGRAWKASLKKKVLPFLYNHVADLVLVPSTASKRFICSLGVKEERVALTPYVVDNDYIAAAAARSDRKKTREEWRIPDGAAVAILCAKFLPRKRPQDALEAFARAGVEDSYLVMVGDGPLGDSLKEQAERLGIADRVRFAGIVKYSRLAEFYAASDVLLFTSEHEPYGLPVNEAMICGIPAIVSDRVGAGYDLVEDGKTGYVYPCGDVAALSRILREVLPDRRLLKTMGKQARARLTSWSPRDNAEATILAVEKAMANRE